MIKKIIILLLFILSVALHSRTIEHIIKPGDTIFGLAMKFNTTTSKIMKDNDLTTSLLSIGQNLIINIIEPDEYIVKKGDNLSSIAYNKNITLKHLLLLNRIDETHNIKEGDRLIIPTSPEIKKEYIVKKGDTLSWISMAYNIDVKKISEINSIKNNAISIGDKILLTDKNNLIPIIKQASISLPIISPIKKDNNKIYTVKKGDTLLALAIEFGTTTEELISLNNLKSQ
ncbi:MAG: hypothetical protein B6229_03200 [Spirochaetaceae bacterium 4572_7]|nr:MAG: hypothetical protein B6229_03200 [Spirochaetaceae bacterium 4572_7]